MSKLKYGCELFELGDHPCRDLQEIYNSSGWVFYFRPIVSYRQDEYPINGQGRVFVLDFILDKFRIRFYNDPKRI